jgi:hypothetical protein
MKIRSVLFLLSLYCLTLPLVYSLPNPGWANDSVSEKKEAATNKSSKNAIKTPDKARNSKKENSHEKARTDKKHEKSTDQPTKKPHRSPLGINTNEVFEQDASIPFVDLFRVATPFNENIYCRKQDQPCLTSASVEYDKHGWPSKLNGGKAGAFFLRNVPLAALPEGDYSVVYEGKGHIEYLQNVEVVSRKPGLDIIRFNARSDGFMTAALQITESDPDKPLRKIRILMPGGVCSNDQFHHARDASECKGAKFLDYKTYSASIIFNPDYMNFMKDFGVIRFMPMSGITRDPAVHWDERPNMDEATWGGIYGSRGAPLEVQIALANRLKANPWFNVPHAADDDYMRKFATAVHKYLSPELTPYIEYTNEAWNANFVHNEHMQKMGIAQKLDQDALMAGYKYYAKRSVEFFKIWEDVYGGHERFVRLIGGWDTRPDISGIILAYNDTYKNVDALAIAPYIGGNLRGFRAAKTVDDIFHLLTDKKSYRSLPRIIEEIKKQAAVAKDFGVSLIAYEGGQGLVDWAAKDYLQHPNPLFFASNRDDRMADLYAKLYKEWRDLGADLFVAFSAPRSCNWSGCWGLKEHIRQKTEDAPKLMASLKFGKDNQVWWDWKKLKKKSRPGSSKLKHYLGDIDPEKPRIVIRPAKGDPEHFHRLENPQALNILLEGETWDKRDISGKWQVKWNKDSIYLIVKVYDKEAKTDSEDPTQDDSIEFFIDGNNSRGRKFDKKNDYHFIFIRGSNKVIFGKENPRNKGIEIPLEWEKKYDGYEMRAVISWKELGITPKVTKKLGMDVIINDDDDGGDRDARIGWNTRKSHPVPKDFGMILMSGR